MKQQQSNNNMSTSNKIEKEKQEILKMLKIEESNLSEEELEFLEKEISIYFKRVDDLEKFIYENEKDQEKAMEAIITIGSLLED